MTQLTKDTFLKELIKSVWEKGIVIPYLSSKMWRKDKYGTLIKFDEYGQDTTRGWQINCIKPSQEETANQIDNLQPLFWYRNDLKSNRYPYTDQMAKDDNQAIEEKISSLKVPLSL